MPFLFTDWRRDCAPTDGALHKSDNWGKEKRKKGNPPGELPLLYMQMRLNVLNIKLDAVIIPHHENAEVYFIHDRVSRAEQGKIDESSLSAGGNSFSLRRRRNGLESKGEGAADSGCEPSSR